VSAWLALKWREEIGEKFGPDFTILDARSTAGASPHPRPGGQPVRSVPAEMVIHLQWLRTPRVHNLLDEVLKP
jgi:hypothetical protein